MLPHCATFCPCGARERLSVWAVEELRRGAGAQFDATVVDALARTMGEAAERADGEGQDVVRGRALSKRPQPSGRC
jgi:hypothetical protein